MKMSHAVQYILWLMITMIAAVEKQNIIGNKDGDLPWAGDMPNDVSYWRAYVKGKKVIVGSRTFKVLGPLDPTISYIVLTHSPHSFDVEAFVPVHVLPVGTIDEALGAVIDSEETVVIGGAAIYSQFLPFADKLLLTHIDMEASVEEPVYFPEMIEDRWQQATKEELPADANNKYSSVRVCLERKV